MYSIKKRNKFNEKTKKNKREKQQQNIIDNYLSMYNMDINIENLEREYGIKGLYRTYHKIYIWYFEDKIILHSKQKKFLKKLHKYFKEIQDNMFPSFIEFDKL